jgi:cytochrome c-type biogenesis protein CcsB
METLLFKIAYGFYTLSTVLYLAYLFTKRPKISRAAFWVLVVAVTIHVGSLVTRTVVARHMYMDQAQILRNEGKIDAAIGAERAASAYVPWSNWFESFSFFGAVISLVYLIIAWRSPIPILGSFIMLISWGLLTGSLTRPNKIQPLMPALHSYWMAIHVPVMFTSYSILSIAFAVALAYLIQERQLKAKHPTAFSFQLPSLDQLDHMMYKLILTAFPLLTLGIFLGGVWAYTAWGRFWGWDPKETWALITWFVYVVYLHMRLFKGWRGRKVAYVSIAGFVSILFTFIGVNYLSPLHGFLSGQGR